MNYSLNEGVIDLPSAEYFDGSINIIRFDKLGTSLVITRGKLQDGETVESNFEGQLKKLKSQMKEVKFQGRTDVLFGKVSNISGIEIRSQYRDGDKRVYQLQLVWGLPGNRVMAMSYIKPSPIGETESQHWDVIKSGVDFADL